MLGKERNKTHATGQYKRFNGDDSIKRNRFLLCNSVPDGTSYLLAYSFRSSD